MSQAAEVYSGGCGSCHFKLSEKLPETHPSVPEQGIKECLDCHSQAGGADPLEWLAHFRHFGMDKFTGNCWSCHQMDAEGNFFLIGAEGKRGIKVSQSMVEKMVPYFKSWATSKFMGHGHARKKISCNLCHETFFPQRWAPQEQCLKCHESYQHVSELTRKLDPNPHTSHLGEIRCTLCHKAHEKSALYCNQCHASDPRFPKNDE
jgi:hypothetical protein